MKYIVECTKIYNGSMIVEANSEEEAVQKAQDNLAENTECIDWNFGEATADYAEDGE